MPANRYGAVIFDQPNLFSVGEHSQNSGWACINGEDPFRVRGTADLSTSVKWLTNLSCQICWEAGFSETQHLLSDDYLGPRVDVLLLELGFLLADPREQSYLLSVVFSRFLQLGRVMYGVKPGRYGYSWWLADKVAQQHVKVDAVMHELCSAGCGFQVCNTHLLRPGGGEAGAEVLLFTRPRFDYADEILQAGAPAGLFRKVSDRNLPARSARMDWVKKSRAGVFCEVEIGNMPADLWSLFLRSRGIRKHWDLPEGGILQNLQALVTTSEMEFLNQVASVSIEGVWSEREGIKVCAQPPTRDRLMQVSFSYGLLLENLWRTTMRTPQGERPCSPKTAWIQGCDRGQLLLDAVRICGLEGAHNIIYLASGQMAINVYRRNRSDIIARAYGCGYVPSMGYAGNDKFAMKAAIESSRCSQQVFASWAAANAITQLLAADEEALDAALDNNGWRGDGRFQLPSTDCSAFV